MKKLLALLILILCVALPAISEQELKYMAYNFYSDPHMHETSGRFDSFLIDFMAEKTPNATYWAMANFSLDVKSAKTQKAFEGIRGVNGYAGVQNSDRKVGIISFWEAKYKKNGEDALLHAQRIYPEGHTKFAHEGEGTNCIEPYDWVSGQWYRMLLHSWDDIETGTTFAGLWFQDIKSGKWQLFSYFNTLLYNSCFIRNFSQFMENFYGGDPKTNCNVERNVFFKNMYVHDHERKDWVSIHTATLSYGDGGGTMEHQKKFGGHTFGATEEHFWGITGGKVENQAAYEEAAVKRSKHTINQPEKPELGEPKIAKLSLDNKKKNLTWSFDEKSTPQLAYRVKAFNTKGQVVFEKAGTRPEVRSLELPAMKSDAFKVTLTVVDVFGNKDEAEYTTRLYRSAVKDVAKN
ncbi:DUF3472 domain-containing protein [bacterium]|nr:DUF3472 domain-containing protein [bacterium]